MGWEAWFTGGLVMALMGVLAMTRAAPDMVLLGGLALLVLVGIGGYRFSDYLRAGLPLNGVVGCVSLGMILWWYF